MKIIATITDFGAKLNIGGDEVRESFVLFIPDGKVPEPIKKYLYDSKISKYQTLSFSIFRED